MEADPVEVGVALLSAVGRDRLTLAEAVDVVETVTTDPHRTREILDAAAMRGVIDRQDGIVRVRRGAAGDREPEIRRREGSFTCRRCGSSCSTGYFVVLEPGEHGPFGSSCVRRVTGREPLNDRG